MTELKFEVDPAVYGLGVRGIYFAVYGIENSSSGDAFGRDFEDRSEQALAGLDKAAIKADPVLAGFRELHTRVGRSNRDYVSAPEALMVAAIRRGLPRINPVVDIYNLWSLESRLALGAHDLARVAGSITLRMTDGDERYVPLGSDEPKPVFPGEYAYVDASDEVLCRMEVKQVEKTKVTGQTRDCFFIVQGHEQVPNEDLVRTAEGLIDEIVGRLGGRVDHLASVLSPSGS
jgi:DNA/RNA-binding domain of Phe-tRNA-synthetase-like protein